ncbi:hypothetical protein GSI_10434 [Ganoderma sinense ZZ0214-1]|uniref:GH16 domain-containing protein n=1 Tax=Ganoderma sinense ZZ0214-1 TaxID=1077348 RepID=A0A2G8S0L7_9APHY|nr:hypothetical protein GSI_10434 [Ganoderma sinense ZZ0214-1]
MYRRRDTQNGPTSYRSLKSQAASTSRSNSGPTDSSEDESQRRRHASTPIAESFSRRRSTESTRNNAPLAPPRPFFFEDDTRQSWSGSSESTSVAGEQSDSDSTPPAATSSRKATVGTTPRTPSRDASVRSPRSLAVPPPAASPSPSRVRTRNHRRGSAVANEYAHEPDSVQMTPVTTPTLRPSSPPASTVSNPFGTPRSSLYGAITPGATSTVIPGARPPPSSFPFQSHPGNPDPGTPLPGMARRASIENIRAHEAAHQRDWSVGTVYPPGSGIAGYGRVVSSGDLVGEYGPPYAPFMGSGEYLREGSVTPPNPTGSRVFMNSAAAAMGGSGHGNEAYLPRTQSSPAIVNMRAPFLSPASRPTSSVWSPPPHASPYPPGGSDSSFSALPRKMKPPMPSSRLSHKLSKEDKPWLRQRDWRDRASWWVTFAMIVLGAGAAGVLCFFGWNSVQMLTDADLCMVLDENFDSLDLQNTWSPDVELGGFGNGEFQMTTTSDSNLFVQDGQLYIMPTLTSDVIGRDAIFDGGSYSLDGCTTDNQTACSVTSSNGDGSTIQPVQSARISTMNSVTIAYGKVEVRAKLPRGDWLWPAIWMLPKDNTYGPWPLSGEIDIVESRGNGLSYPAQGSNFVRASLNYGVLPAVQTHLFGWWSQKRASYDQDFHVYTLEWTPSWMRFSVDSRLQSMMDIQITGKHGKDFFDRGHYPATATNGSSVAVVVNNIWQEAGGSAAAPFDQQFYLILDVAAGGTSGWFPDNVGGKPWFDGSDTAMRDFAKAQDTWAATWPSSAQDRAMRVDYVKMWKLGSC